MHFKRNLLSAALASAIALTATGVQAQTAQAPAEQNQTDATELDTVVVTGIRRGIESAISVKRDSTSIVEAVSAEDIGKLPDVSIGESIGRLPGLAAQRVAGRAQVISVRGLSPDFSTTTLNGREMVSTGDNRSVEFDQYPSELVAGVTVYKTPDAGLVGQGLSGTIDMQTVRPLSFDAPVGTIGVRGQRNALGAAADSSAYGERINASYITQNEARTLGLSIGYSHSTTPIQENQVGLYEPWQAIGDNWRPGVPAGTFYSDGIKALRRTGETRRDGVMATLQFRPSNAWTSTLDLFHSRARQVDTANQFEVHIGDYNGGYGRLQVTNPSINGDNTFTGGTVGNVYPLVRGMYNKREDEINAFGWNNEFTAGQARIIADIGWSRAKRDELNLENNTQMLPAPQLDALQLQIRNNGFSQINPGRNYSDPNSLYLTGTIYGSGYGKVPNVVDELRTGKLGASLPAPSFLSWMSDIDVGLNYADREKNKRQPEGNINLGPQGNTTIGSDLQYRPVDLSFAGIGYIPSWNVPAAVARYMTFEPNAIAPYLIAKSWDVREKTSTAYVRGNIDTEWGGVSVRGNAGVQVQRIDQSSDAVRLSGGSNTQPIRMGKTFTDVLPSLNLAFGFDHDQTLRVALAKQVARPRVDQLRASLEVTASDGPDQDNGLRNSFASGGNPLLDPWRAYAFDVSYEKYFGTKAYVAAAYFYKDLQTYIYTQTDPFYDLSAYTPDIPPSTNNPGIGVDPTGSYSRPVNGEGGTLQGLELTASLPFDMFSDALQGFGAVASATFNDSNIQIRDPESASSVGAGDIDLPGLSKRVYNLTVYFEKNGFEARVNQRRRSDFIGEIGNFNGNRTLRYVVGENITDAQVSYTFPDGHALSGLSVLFQASNLTNEAYQTYAGTKDRPLEYVEWGRSYLLGVSYKF
ncbi:MAG: TonB-dependent receptor [Xanthomonas sp.]|uniref:TonB-dependent receptor n=1 Tax=Pseudoxanthomonas mexicana TaxID=128785 RepID=UPI000783D070|nr:TonB-dependent receptor [Pseudoxanthomonas mexicana]MBA3930943.1 TonB-dependent receptor [Xanthomonas sp.]MBL8255533.1 TonB-dependent receptor [Pseudoxanthomonas mexicana]